MKALVWHGKSDVRCDNVPDPKIEDPRDVIVQITSTAICGSDLHLFDGYMPAMEEGDIFGHEPMGKVVEVGKSVKNLEVGDRVVVPFTIACGECFFCQKELYSCCDTTNRDAEAAAKLMGHAPAGLFGYSHITGHIRVARRNISAFPTPTSARSKSRTIHSATSRYSFFPISFRPATWRRKMPRSKPATQLPSGAVARSVSSRFKARGCLGPDG